MILNAQKYISLRWKNSKFSKYVLLVKKLFFPIASACDETFSFLRCCCYVNALVYNFKLCYSSYLTHRTRLLYRVGWKSARLWDGEEDGVYLPVEIIQKRSHISPRWSKFKHEKKARAIYGTILIGCCLPTLNSLCMRWDATMLIPSFIFYFI